MKKISLIILFIFISSFALAITVKQARMNLGYELNQTVNVLKEYFHTVKVTLEQDSNSIVELNAKVDDLISKSEEGEQNYTVLPQGRVFLPICKDNEELVWKSSSWKCQSPLYGMDCITGPGETKVAVKSGGYDCQQNGIYKAIDAGWTSCNNVEQKSVIRCMFTNSVTNQSYQVAGGCNGIDNYKKPCGVNGANSSCKCPAGTYYLYEDGKSNCAYAEEETILNGKTYSLNFCTDHFAKLRIVPDGEYIEIMLVGQGPSGGIDGRCGYGDYSNGWLRSKGLGTPSSAYKRVDRIYVGSEISDINGFSYSFSSSGPGCRPVSGSGSGDSTSSSSSDNSPTHGYGFDNSSLTYCPGDSAQSPKIELKFNKLTGKKIIRQNVVKCKI